LSQCGLHRLFFFRKEEALVDAKASLKFPVDSALPAERFFD